MLVTIQGKVDNHCQMLYLLKYYFSFVMKYFSMHHLLSGQDTNKMYQFCRKIISKIRTVLGASS